MEDLSLHILDIVENGTRAGASLVEIRIREDRERDLLEITIRDDGKGMDREMLNRVRDPFCTTRTTRRVGMGLPLLEQAAEETGGGLTVASTPGQGTEVHATFGAGHIDRKPLGDLGATLVALILGNPEMEFVCEYVSNGDVTAVDTRELKAELQGVSLTEPAVLNLITDLFRTAQEDRSGPGGGTEDG